MTTAEATLFGMGQFWLQDGGTPPAVETWDQSNGLAVTADVGAVILTGDAYGPVQVAVDVRAERPPEADDPFAFGDGSEWDDIVEVSVTCREGPLNVGALEGELSDELPAVDTRGAGSYRVRVHTRDRDDPGVDDDGMPRPNDRFLLVSWPAPPQPPLLIRLTDRRGLGTRMAWVKRLSRGRPPARGDDSG
ncbi:hypothetical protein [Frankia sp. Cr2]|uniref:hypothetical protein n=1 Tax=Frankia sp. Cr2 TaxID=3073932 RepID=UPI002AD32A21|nr:hypothetical protein [Frankia sp. Cr2]